MELSQVWLEALLPSHRWIRWEIATFGHNTTNIEKAYQEFCESLLSSAKQCIPHGRRKNYVPCWDKEWETLYHSFTWAPVGTDSDRAALSLLSRIEQKKQEWWKKLSIPSTSRTLAARHGASSTNLLVGLDAPLTCAPSHQTPPPHSLWRAGHTRLGAASPPGSSIRRCPPYGRFQNLKETVETVSLALSGQRSLQTPGARKVFGVGLHLPGVYTPRRVSSQTLVYDFFNFLLATQNSKDLEKNTNRCDPKSRKAIGGAKNLSPHTPSVCPFMTSRDSSTLVSYESSTYCFHRSRRAFDTGGQP